MDFFDKVFLKCIRTVKIIILKIRYCSRIKLSINESISLSTIIRISKNSQICFGKHVATRNHVEFNANDGRKNKNRK